MLKARWAARENAPDTADPGHHPRAGHRLGQGRRGQELGHGEPGRRHRRARATPSACSTPTSGASRCPACSASPTGSRPARTATGDGAHPAQRARRSAPGMLKVVSTGNLVDDEGTALMWRGLMLTKAVEQFLRDVQWGDARLPAHRHAARHRRRADGPGPPAAPHRPHHRHHAGAGRAEGGHPGRRHGPAQLPAGRRRHREHERVHLRARHVATPCSARAAARTLADEIGAPLLGQVPLEPAVAAGGDAGVPVALDGAGRRGRGVPGHRRRCIVTETVPPVRMAGCSARLLDDRCALGPARTGKPGA